MNRDEYVSTLCRIGDHAGCQERPVVKCDCECHGPDERKMSPGSGHRANRLPGRAG